MYTEFVYTVESAGHEERERERERGRERDDDARNFVAAEFR